MNPRMPNLSRPPADLQVAPWAGGLNWAYEIRRLGRIMQCRGTHHRRFQRTCAQLTPTRLRSPVECNRGAVDAILSLLESCGSGEPRIAVGRYGPHRTGWTRAEFGELLCIARNRAQLYRLGRELPKAKGPKLDPRRIPDDALARLIQQHRDLAVVDALRDERRRRQLQGADQ